MQQQGTMTSGWASLAWGGVLVGALAGCGGGGDSGNSSDANGAETTQPAPAPAPAPAPELSPNQQIFEELSLGESSGGSHQLLLGLAASGPQVPGVNFAWSDSAFLTASPLISGPQLDRQGAPASLSPALPLLTVLPQRILKNGAILVVPGTQGARTVTYVGGDVQVATLAADNTTVAHSVLRTNYTSVALTGALSGSPADLQQAYGALFTNATVLRPGAVYAPGARYIKYTSISVGDRYTAFDCFAATADANPSPCATQISLTAALANGIASSSDRRTYRLADGQVSTVGGIPVWIATAPRPSSATLSAATEYRIYFQLNNNVYTGSFIKDGSVLGTSAVPFQVRLNKAARDSVASAFAS